MNYTELRQSIIDFTESTDTTFESNIDTFIDNAERRIYNSVLIPVLRKNVTGVVTTNNKYLSCPSDFLAPYELAVLVPDGLLPPTTNYEYLLQKDVSYVRQAFTDASYTGVPKYYAQFDQNTFILAPTPTGSYAIELHYYYYPASIVDVGTSWLGTNFETVLLYGSVREAYVYLKGEQDIMNFYEQKYQESLGLLKRLGDGLDREDAYRSGQVRVKVT